jgi:hypothetical protein
MGLAEKLKVCWYWLVGHGEALFECCHYCQSTQITKVDGHDEGDYYHAKYKCRKCGATCEATEKWQK